MTEIVALIGDALFVAEMIRCAAGEAPSSRR